MPPPGLLDRTPQPAVPEPGGQMRILVSLHERGDELGERLIDDAPDSNILTGWLWPLCLRAAWLRCAAAAAVAAIARRRLLGTTLPAEIRVASVISRTFNSTSGFRYWPRAASSRSCGSVSRSTVFTSWTASW